MLHCTVKFCGGCNPRYDRGAAYRTIAAQTADIASFSYPKDGASYDVLLIIRGCTGCPYLYEDIDATHRIICADETELASVCDAVRALSPETKRIHK